MHGARSSLPVSIEERFAESRANVSVLWRTFAARSSACVGSMDQHVASGRTLPLPALRMARTLGEAGMRSIERAGAPMHVKDAQVEITKATERAVIYGKCPSVTGKFDDHSFPSTGWVMCANAEQSWSRRGDAN